MAPPGYAPHYEVQLDLYIARRKRLHSVINPDGIPVFYTPHLIEVLDWLADKDTSSARFTDDATTYDVTFRLCVPPKPPIKD